MQRVYTWCVTKPEINTRRENFYSGILSFEFVTPEMLFKLHLTREFLRNKYVKRDQDPLTPPRFLFATLEWYVSQEEVIKIFMIFL